MKKQILYYSFAIAMLIGVYGVANSVSAQIAGGYGDAEVSAKDVKNAAAFAVKARTAQTHKSVRLVSIEKAEMQVVAGLNYRLCMKVRDGKGRISTVTAVVYKNLKNRKSLSNWKAGGCTEL